MSTVSVCIYLTFFHETSANQIQPINHWLRNESLVNRIYDYKLGRTDLTGILRVLSALGTQVISTY